MEERFTAAKCPADNPLVLADVFSETSVAYLPPSAHAHTSLKTGKERSKERLASSRHDYGTGGPGSHEGRSAALAFQCIYFLFSIDRNCCNESFAFGLFSRNWSNRSLSIEQLLELANWTTTNKPLRS